MGLARKIFQPKADDKATFCSPVEMNATGLVSKNTEERMFVVHSGTSMHMLSKKDLSSDELVTLRRSRNPTTVVTTNGEVQTHEEAQVHVHYLGFFVNMQILQETPAVLSRSRPSKNTTNIPREDPPERKKNENGGGSEKKRAKFGAVLRRGGSAQGGPAQGVGRRGAGGVWQKRSGAGSGGGGAQCPHTQTHRHRHTITQHTTHTHTHTQTPLPKEWPKMDWPKMD